MTEIETQEGVSLIYPYIVKPTVETPEQREAFDRESNILELTSTLRQIEYLERRAEELLQSMPREDTETAYRHLNTSSPKQS